MATVPDLLTPKEVASVLKISYEGVLNLMRYGGLKFVKIGRKYRVKASDLSAFINGGGTK